MGETVDPAGGGRSAIPSVPARVLEFRTCVVIVPGDAVFVPFMIAKPWPKMAPYSVPSGPKAMPSALVAV